MPRLQLSVTILLTALKLFVPTAARAHITIAPLQSMAGATEKYVHARVGKWSCDESRW